MGRIYANSFLRAIFPPRCISDIMIWLWIALASSAGSSQEQNVSTSNFFILNNQSSEEAGMWSEGWDRLLLNNRWGYLFWEQLREASIIFFCSLLCSYYHDTGCCCWIINEVIYSGNAGSLNSFCYRHHTSRIVLCISKRGIQCLFYKTNGSFWMWNEI